MVRVLCVGNKGLPRSDYKLAYARRSQLCHTTFGLPTKPIGLSDNNFVLVRVAEGLRLAYFIALAELWLYLFRQRTRLDLAHFYSTILVLCGPTVARAAGVRCFVTITGFGRTFSGVGWRYKLIRPVYRCLFRTAVALSDRVLFQNHADMIETVSKYQQWRHKCKYVGSSVSAEPVHAKDFSSSILRVVNIARLMPDKGIDDFLNVAAQLTRPDIEFILIGPASLGFESLHQRVREAHESGAIRYRGELTSSQIEGELKVAHILFFPSFAEGMARVMLEAGFAQVCPVAYDIPANRDLVSEGRGFLVQKRDTREVLRLLQRLACNREQLHENARAYQAHILESYNERAYAERLDSIVKDWLNEARRGAPARRT